MNISFKAPGNIRYRKKPHICMYLVRGSKWMLLTPLHSSLNFTFHPSVLMSKHKGIYLHVWKELESNCGISQRILKLFSHKSNTSLCHSSTSTRGTSGRASDIVMISRFITFTTSLIKERLEHKYFQLVLSFLRISYVCTLIECAINKMVFG